MATLYYFHDPMCSWCWGYRPVADRLFAALPEGMHRVNVLGGLAPDTDEPMPDDIRNMVMGHWRRIESLLGTQFNYEFWSRNQPRRATWPACRAVIAAALQGAAKVPAPVPEPTPEEEAMIDAIQRAYYLQARNPSDDAVLTDLAGGLGLDQERFAYDLNSTETRERLQRDLALTSQARIPGFPSLALDHAGDITIIPVDYSDHRPALRMIAALI